MQIREITRFLESVAPRSLQESYDNSGLIVGYPNQKVNKVLVSLDVTEAVVEEAITKNCEMIVSHHPIVFSGLKTFTGKTYVERTVMLAIKNNIALYAMHTNLDNVAVGVNNVIGKKLKVENRRILAPKRNLLKKVVVFVPIADKDEVAQAMFAAGAGQIGNYEECSFESEGMGTFKPGANSKPSTGAIGTKQKEPEVRLEVLVEQSALSGVLKAMQDAHPYEEVAYDILSIENVHPQIGSGMIGRLKEPQYAFDFLQNIKDTFGGGLRYTDITKDQIETVAWCGGSGSFLLPQAIAAGADIFITSDFKYHQFFDAEQKITIADIGHYENEQFTKALIADFLIEKFPSFAVLLTDTNTNPIKYL